jgi:hypothetical protein
MNTRKYIFHIFGVLSLLLTQDSSLAQIRSIDLLGGVVYNIPTPLLITQEKRDNFVHTAEYDTKSFKDVPYFVLRLNYKMTRNMLEFQYTHHKIELRNTTSNIQHFEITDGFNILSINYRIISKLFDYRIGLGAAIVYTKSTVMGYDYKSKQGIFNSGYFVAGPVLILGANKELKISGNFYMNLELQFTTSWVLVPIAAGYAHVSNLGIHFLLGMGYKF